VQAAGRAGFFFLAHGAPGGVERWDELSGLLEDAHTHFDRVLLALDPKVPRAAALPLGGRVLEAWWAEPGPGLSRSAVALSERLGISFSCFDLNWLMEAMLEAGPAAPAPVSDASLALEVTGAPSLDSFTREDSPAPTVPQSVEEAFEPVAAGPGPTVATEAFARSGGGVVVLGCDPEVRERLRFMVWMRRVRAERRAAAFETSASH
jgi:hypothetical protein